MGGVAIVSHFGSDELSAQSPAVMERIPESYIAMNNADAAKADINEGDLLEIFIENEKRKFPVKLDSGLSEGTIGLPKGLDETAGIKFPVLDNH